MDKIVLYVGLTWVTLDIVLVVTVVSVTVVVSVIALVLDTMGWL